MPRQKKKTQKTPTQNAPLQESERDTTNEASTEELEMQDSIDKVLESWPVSKKFIWEVDGEELLCEAWMLKQIVREGTMPRDMLKNIIATADQKIDVVENEHGEVVSWSDSKNSPDAHGMGAK
jgi:hypothetical protein